MDRIEEYFREIEAAIDQRAKDNPEDIFLSDFQRNQFVKGLTWDSFKIHVDKILPHLPKNHKYYLVWKFEKFGGLPQNKMCSEIEVTPRHYRDMRDRHEKEFVEYLREEDDGYQLAISKESTQEEINEYYLKEAVADMELIGVPGAREWFEGEDNKKIDKFLKDVWEYNGGYSDLHHKWIKCKVLRYWFSLSEEERKKLRE